MGQVVMPSKLLLAAALLAGTIFTPMAGPARDRGDNYFSAVSQADDSVYDLDQLQGALEQELTDELDDIFQLINHDGHVSLEYAHQVVMYALSDAGDDANESIIDFDELEAEMEEAGTTLEQEVWDALEEADHYGSRTPPGIHQVASRNLHLIASDGMTTRRAVFAKVKPRLIRVIRDY